MAEIAKRPYADVALGEALPVRSYAPNGLHAGLMNFANWATHRIHYDQDWARHDGFDGVVIQIGLLYAWVETMLVEWAGTPAAIRKIAFRNHALGLVGDSFEVGGEITAMRAGQLVECATWVRKSDGTVCVTGTASIRLG